MAKTSSAMRSSSAMGVGGGALRAGQNSTTEITSKKQMIETAKKYIVENGIELAKLEGSEKQIAWATDLRYTAIGACLQIGTPTKELFTLFNTKTSAAWWINNDVNVTSPRSIVTVLRK